MLLYIYIAAFFATLLSAAPLEEYEYVTCGSAIKLTNKAMNMRLHSHDINWGTGSGQQSVTVHGSVDDMNSLWIVKEGHGEKECVRGLPINCDTNIRLEHASTQKNLHSHLYKSPISGGQEVSGFGKGEGDRGDSWTVKCGSGEKQLKREVPFYLQHVDTRGYLSSSNRNLFNHQNCPNCPIVGQGEVSCVKYQNEDSLWYADLGLYYKL